MTGRLMSGIEIKREHALLLKIKTTTTEEVAALFSIPVDSDCNRCLPATLPL